MTAVEDVSLSLHRGDVLGLLGVNGAGKSTTLSLICGLLAPSAGWVRIDGQDIAQYPLQCRSKLGYLPDTPPLQGDLRVHEYIRYAARLHRVPRQLTPDAVDRALAVCQLDEVADRRIHNLSKGFRQRVGLAQAIVLRPALLILDEPSSGLDPLQLLHMRKLLAALSNDCGIILSTHILGEVTAVCDRVAILHGGKLVHEETLQNTSNGHSRHHLTLAAPVSNDDLLAVPSILHAEVNGEQSWQITLTADSENAALSDILARGWQVREFGAARNHLEERFATLTLGHPSAVNSA